MRELNKKPAFEAALRVALTDPLIKSEILDATGWDESMPSKVLSGHAGITLEKLDKALQSLGLVVVPVSFMEYLAFGNKIGTNCSCARAGYGVCGKN